MENEIILGKGPLIEVEGGEYVGDKYLFPISMKMTGSRGIMFNSHILWSNVIGRQRRTGVFEIREEDRIVRGFVNPEVKDYDVYCKFDIDKHKAKYIDYLEVIILEDGTVEYAIPSHQMKLIEVATKKLGKTKEEISDMCPHERYGDYNEWLCEISDSVCVWHWFHMGKCNQMQKEVLQKIKRLRSLYRRNQHKGGKKVMNENNMIFGFKGKYYFLSNFYSCPVTYHGITYLNSEAAFHAQKNPSRAHEFARLNPSQAKRLGRSVELRPDWEEVKDRIMEEVVYMKFIQNEELSAKLLKTGDRILVEANTWHDSYWGYDEINNCGQNRLGYILMLVRKRLGGQ